jgi:hypothetical protein
MFHLIPSRIDRWAICFLDLQLLRGCNELVRLRCLASGIERRVVGVATAGKGTGLECARSLHHEGFSQNTGAYDRLRGL